MNKLFLKTRPLKFLFAAFFYLILFPQVLTAQKGSMQRLTVYEKNKAYFYDNNLNRPVFLSGQGVWTSICTPELWYSHSPIAFTEKYNNKEDNILNPDEVFDYLALKGGNCCRLTTFYPGSPEKTPGPVYYPWAPARGSKMSVNGTSVFDLLAFDEIYWERFRHFLGLCESKNIYVFLDVFPNLWRYKSSPLNPDNNINYTKEDMPSSREWYTSVDKGSKKVLAIQEAFVKKVVLESLPFKNVIYMINNQYLSEVADIITNAVGTKDELVVDRDHSLAWPRYWASFIKEMGKQKGENLLVSTMPHFHSADSPLKDNFQWYIDDDLFDFVDAGWWREHPFYPEYSTRETDWMELFDAIPLRERVAIYSKTILSWRDYLEKTNHVKPLTMSKSLFWDGVLRHSPWPLWIGFVSGYAVSSPHEPMSRSYWNAPRYEPTADISGNLQRFIRETKIEFWNMKSMNNVASGNGQDAYVLANIGQEYIVYLVGESEGPLLMQLPEGEYIVEYYDPKVGQWIDTKLISGKAATEIFVHKHYDELALLIQKKEKREAVMGMKFP